jgi:hypothetical protein
LTANSFSFVSKTKEISFALSEDRYQGNKNSIKKRVLSIVPAKMLSSATFTRGL